MNSHTGENKKFSKFALLALGALGVVYGDIGTSPLYSINEIFFGHAHLYHTKETILGAISIVLWALTIIVSFKYIIFVLRADNDGEGGVFALYGLVRHLKTKSVAILLTLLIIAAGLLFGDGIITPAISVISAIEGLKVATPLFAPYVVPLTVLILTGLFMIQSKGTAKIGTFFGPIISVWFVCIAAAGLFNILQSPEIINAVNPIHAINFFRSHEIHTLLIVLGSVMLVVTGGEAMYADMGHFGRLPIRISWFSVVYPALLLNYLGQGAYLLSGEKIIGENIFYSMVPSWGLLPMVILATLATIIASQALISGAFSLTMQAIQLGLLPYIKVRHTHEEHQGQIYIPFVNWILYIGCVLLVITFRSSSNLASAYGLAVSGVMLVTSIGMAMISYHYWKWSWIRSVALWAPLACIDLIFLISNSLKLLSGGYIPLLIGLGVLIFMQTWEWGRKHVTNTLEKLNDDTVADLIRIKKENDTIVPRSIVLMTKQPLEKLGDTSPYMQLFINRYGVLPKHLILLNVDVIDIPHAHDNRYTITKFYEDENKGSIVAVKAKYGYMEDIDVELLLKDLAKQKEINIDENPRDWLIHAVHERVLRGEFKSSLDKMRYILFIMIHRVTSHADTYFNLGRKNKLTIEILPVYIH